jgi:hypothetical protein
MESVSKDKQPGKVAEALRDQLNSFLPEEQKAEQKWNLINGAGYFGLSRASKKGVPIIFIPTAVDKELRNTVFRRDEQGHAIVLINEVDLADDVPGRRKEFRNMAEQIDWILRCENIEAHIEKGSTGNRIWL